MEPSPAEDVRPDVCVVVHDLRGGGAERVTVRLIAGMVAAGRSVELIMFQRRGDYLGDLPPQVRVTDLGAPRVLLGIGRLARRLRAARPRAVLSVMTHVNIAAILACRLAGCRGMLAVAEHNTMSVKIAAAKRAAARLSYRAVPLVYRLAPTVVAVSEAAADDLRRLTGLTNVRVLYNPVVDEALAAQAEAPVDHPWFAPDQPPVVLAVGRLHPQKGFPDLLRAFAAVRARRPLRLIILGEGEERPALEALARELGVEQDVAMPGFAANPYAYMRNAGLFVLSSHWEGLPTVLIEALACGAPVVATDCPSGPREILRDGAFGRLVPVGDTAALAQAIQAALDEPASPEALKARAADFTVERATEGYLATLGV